MIARVSARLAPRMRLDNEINPSNLSRDPEVGRAYAADPLVNRKVSAKWFSEATRAMPEVAEWAPKIKAPILVMHDGPSNLDKVKFALDNLTVAKDVERKLPAFIAIAVENGGDDSKGSERGLEYDTMSDRLARFINDEVLPAVLNNAEIKAAYPNIAFTENPLGQGCDGVQFRWCSGTYHGLVSAGSI